MNISQQQATESLNLISKTSDKTRRIIASEYAAPILILWGAVYIAAFIGTHFWLQHAGIIWLGLDIIGIIGMVMLFTFKLRNSTPVKISNAKKTGRNIFLFWTLFYIYIILWVEILKPHNGIQLNAFICTAAMFGIIVLAFWLDSYYMLWLGLAVTITTIIGFYIIPHAYYNIWMAVAAGGPLFGTGLYIRLFWK